MPTVEERAREALKDVARERGKPRHFWGRNDRRENYDTLETVCRLIEAHDATIAKSDAFKQEVSDAVEKALADCGHNGMRKAFILEAFSRFILPKPVDPLVEAIREASVSDADDGDASRLRAALAARGGKIVWENANAR